MGNLILGGNSYLGAAAENYSVPVVAASPVLTGNNVVLTPTTSGGVAHGQAFSIPGNGFGTRSVTTFSQAGSTGGLEAGTVGVIPSSGNGWTFTNTTARNSGFIVNDSTRGQCLGSTYGAMGANNFNMAYSLDMGAANVVPPGGRLYISWWVYLVSWNNFNNSGQWKMIRIRDTDGLSDGDANHDWYFKYTDGHQLELTNEATRGGDHINIYDQGGNTLAMASWRRIELDCTYPAVGSTTNSNIRIRIHNGSSVPTNKTFQNSGGFNNSNLPLYDSTYRARYIIFQNYFGNGTGTQSGSIRSDDMVVQVGTAARVELCNNVNYNSAAVRELQPEITSWTNTNVQGLINRGGLANGTYWLHVVSDANTSLGSLQIDLVS
jgi:hypothetical protein